MAKKLFLLDGYALIYRAYFAFIRKPLFNPQGQNSSAVFGFFRNLFSLFDTYDPESFVVVLDSAKPTFRHERYPDYKATREKAPDDLHAQVPVIKEILDAMGILQLQQDGVEADDIIATYAVQAERDGRECYIVSGDKDLMQLVGTHVRALSPDSSGGYALYGPEEVKEKWGVPPSGILDYLALIGDQSDNVPGVKGIGPKTALTLLEEHQSLEGIYQHLDELKPKLREKLIADRENAFLSKELITLKCDVQGLPAPEELIRKEFDGAAVAQLLLEQGAESLAVRFTSQAGVEKAQGRSAYTAESSAYRAIVDETELNELVKRFEQGGEFALDVETDSLDPMRARLIGISLSNAEGTAWYIPVEAPDTDPLSPETIRKAIDRLLGNPDNLWIGQNLKYDYKVLLNWGIASVDCGLFDTMIAAWMIDSTGNNFGMDALAERYLNYRTIHFGDVVEKGKSFESVPLEKALAYAAEDADITFRLYRHLKPELEKEGLIACFTDLEMPITRILVAMERAGIALDGEELIEYGKRLGEELDSIQAEIYSLCGREFNINSTKQLQEVLFQDRKLTPVKKTKTGYSTDTSVLQQLAAEDPVPDLILRHRGLAKLKSTYVDTLPGEINPHTGRIHTSYQQTGTATGRLASKNPNLQNIPVKDDAGRAIRSAFIPKPGYKFISADYAQIELVVFAHLSGDEALSRAFAEGKDIHRQTAGLIFGIGEEQVDAEQRRVAKTINFGVIYGMSAFRLSNELKIPRGDAARFIEAYFNQYPGVKRFMESTVAEAEQSNYVYSLMGHRRFVPGITSRNKTEKAGAERIAVNTPVQGSAADIVKQAMIDLDKRLLSENLDATLLLQVHDELILEVKAEQVDRVSKIVEEVMQSAVKLSVPLKVSLEAGDSWGAVH